MSDYSQYLEKCFFPKSGGEFNIGVSGGSDSVALLILASSLDLKVVVHHVDHGIRGNGENEASFVSEVALKYGCSFVFHKINVEDGPNLEARLRKARFEVLPNDIAMGHTMDDQSETVLLALMRGTGLKGISGMKLGFRHPILGLRRRDTEAIVTSEGVKPFVDPSNDDRRFRRNRVRFELLPLMEDISKRDIVPILARFAQICGEESEYLETLSNVLDERNTRSLREADTVIAKRALRRYLVNESGYPPTFDELARAWQVVEHKVKACELSGGRQLRRSNGILEVIDQNADS